MEAIGERLYFAYGSNMSRRRMDGRCSGHAPVGIAVLEGYALVINTRGVATVVACDGSAVEGVLWRISPQDEAALDGFEGVCEGRYGKHDLPVRLSSGDIVQALVYIDPNGAAGDRCRDGYADFLLEGAAEFRLSDAYCRTLRSALFL